MPYEFSKRGIFYHCGTCGSQMFGHFWHDADDRSKGDQWDILSGSLQKAEGVFEFQAHEFVADTLDGGFTDFLPSIAGKQLPRWSFRPERSEQLPLDWRSPERPSVESSLSSDRVHCSCKCGGVEFWIARPSERSKDAKSELPDLTLPYHSSQPRADDETWWLMDDGKRFLAGVCSCDECRLDSGCEWVEWAFVPTIDISLDAEGKKPYDLPFGAEQGWGTLKGYQSTKKDKSVWRYHCSDCGAMVFFTCDSRTDLIDVAVGVIDAPEGARAESLLEIWTQRLSYREDGMPRAESITLAVEEGLKKFGEKREQ